MQPIGISKQIGAIFILWGTIIGAGILGMPFATANMGFLYSSLLILLVGALIIYSALLTLDANLTLPRGATFFSTNRHYLGNSIGSLTLVIFAITLLAVQSAYISGISSVGQTLLDELDLPLSQISVGVLFALVFGAIIIAGTRYADWACRVLLPIKLLALVLGILILLFFIQPTHLKHVDWRTPTVFTAIPIVVFAMWGQLAIPSLRIYLGDDRQVLKRIILIGFSVPLALYFLFNMVALGLIPLHGASGFLQITAHKAANTGDLLHLLAIHVQHPWLRLPINFFVDISMTTAFLGVGISLYDFFLDFFYSIGIKRNRRLAAGAIVVLVPIIIVILAPNIFITALKYSGLMIVVISLILPALVAYKINSTQTKVHFNNFVLALLLLLSLICIIVSIINVI